MNSKESKPAIARFHLPGLFEFYDLYKIFLPLFAEHREYFTPWCNIGSVYGAPADCLWNGGRVGYGQDNPRSVAALLRDCGISARLTFSNSMLREEHLADAKCRHLCDIFAREGTVQNGVILHSDLLLHFLMEHYPMFYFVSSTTKVITELDRLREELDRKEFRFVVPDFRLNKRLTDESALSPAQRAKVEFLCNECCAITCTERKACYENVSRKALGEDCTDHICHAPHGNEGYVFSRAMQSPAFIGPKDIEQTYLPMGYRHFKIEGRSLGSALILEFLLYYLTKPEYQLHVREKIYLSSSLDLF